MRRTIPGAVSLVRCVARARVPRDLESVTVVRWEAETAPRALGVEAAGVEAIWSAVQRLYRSGLHPAIGLCVRRHGRVLLDRTIGHAAGNGPDDLPDAPKRPLTPDTPFLTLSASKAVTAMLIHLLDQRNLIRLDDPVCEYIPEFGVYGKQWITIRHVLCHRAGIPNLPPEVMALEHFDETAPVIRILCDARPTWRPGRELAYHAVSGGFLLGEIIRRVTGRDPRTFLDEELRRPLGFRWLSYGVPAERTDQVVRNYFTGPPLIPPANLLFARVLGVGFHEAIALSNDARFLRGVIPSANVVATANEMSRFYQLLLDGGELDGVRVFDPRTIRRATGEQSYLEFDFSLVLPFRYGMGFMLGAEWFSLYGPDTQHAFGHLGFTNVVCWADPERELAVALLTSGKPFVYPELWYLWDVLRQIGRACPTVD
ncbi:MAG: beta-lactamase family protein [bacterium]|nr:beta-lactamase family protein [bacterium]